MCIRDSSYTYAQLFLRTGNEIEDISNVLQNASNAIANAVYGDIESSRENIDGEVYYTLPTAHQIGEKDAAETLEQLAMFSSAPGVWSGNPLFIGLGDSSFWQNTILGDSSDTALLHKSADARSFPIPGQTYPVTFVMGVPSAVKPLSTATLTWNSAT